jgi:hypothetical protein
MARLNVEQPCSNLGRLILSVLVEGEKALITRSMALTRSFLVCETWRLESQRRGDDCGWLRLEPCDASYERSVGAILTVQRTAWETRGRIAVTVELFFSCEWTAERNLAEPVGKSLTVRVTASRASPLRRERTASRVAQPSCRRLCMDEQQRPSEIRATCRFLEMLRAGSFVRSGTNCSPRLPCACSPLLNIRRESGRLPMNGCVSLYTSATAHGENT